MDTLTLDDVKTYLPSEKLRGQMKELSVRDSCGGRSSSQCLFAKRGRNEKKGKNFRGHPNCKKPDWRSNSIDGMCQNCKEPDH